MKYKNKAGKISLLSTIGGLAAVETALHLGVVSNPLWRIVATGFEAGTVGGLADWFAVSALFREVPIPMIRRHTNIIVKNRSQLTEGAVDLVTNRWLAPDVIKARLANVPFSQAILRMLQEPKNQDRALELLRDIFSRFAAGLDNPEVAGFLERILKDQIQGLDISKPIGRWIEAAVKRGEHHRIWEMLLESAKRTVNDPNTRRLILKKVKEAVQEYKDKGVTKRAVINIARLIGGLDQSVITDLMIAKMNQFMDEAMGNPAHPVRTKLDHSMIAFAHGLSSGDPSAQESVHILKEKLIDNADARDLIRSILTRFKSTVLAQLVRNDTPFMTMVTGHFSRMLSELESDKATQHKIDLWLSETIIHLADKYHHTIGEMVRSSLDPGKLDDKALVEQIEEKVGDDLQYIRLNGAVVGGLAGILLAIIKLLVF